MTDAERIKDLEEKLLLCQCKNNALMILNADLNRKVLGWSKYNKTVLRELQSTRWYAGNI